MVKLSALITLALTSVALAVTFTDCQNQLDACRSSSSNAACVADHATCCADAFDTCKTSDDPGTAVDCAIQEAHCQGQN
ncbi:hypothetical protein HFD88_002594 [Aspergillus terreus]|jgi:hypothetical protein|nr:hypothetical protein HFD88_002594 [Aspergillus terreus]